MKKKIAALAVTAMVLFTTVFANPAPENINWKMQTIFSEQFPDASEVRWSTSKKYIKASFVMDEQTMFVLYHHNGELIGTARNIISIELPVKLQLQLKKELSGGWITEVLEFSHDDGKTFFATIENADQKVFLKTVGLRSWEVVKKINKD